MKWIFAIAFILFLAGCGQNPMGAIDAPPIITYYTDPYVLSDAMPSPCEMENWLDAHLKNNGIAKKFIDSYYSFAKNFLVTKEGSCQNFSALWVIWAHRHGMRAGAFSNVIHMQAWIELNDGSIVLTNDARFKSAKYSSFENFMEYSKKEGYEVYDGDLNQII